MMHETTNNKKKISASSWLYGKKLLPPVYIHCTRPACLLSRTAKGIISILAAS